MIINGALYNMCFLGLPLRSSEAQGLGPLPSWSKLIQRCLYSSDVILTWKWFGSDLGSQFYKTFCRGVWLETLFGSRNRCMLHIVYRISGECIRSSKITDSPIS